MRKGAGVMDTITYLVSKVLCINNGRSNIIAIYVPWALERT